MNRPKCKNSKLKNFTISIMFIVFLILLDQLSKNLIISFLKNQPLMQYNISSFLDIVHVWNHGISFGLFRNYYQYSNYALLAINIIITLYLLKLLFIENYCIIRFSLSLIIAGAIGNITDRIFKGAVFDFIYFNYETYSFPAFNLADSFISIGAMIYLCCMMRSKSLSEKDQNDV